MIDYKKLAGKEIESLKPYIPGKPVKELERELGVEKALKMASNENPLGPSPKAMEALKDFMPEMGRYPYGDVYYLRKKLAKRLNVDGDRIIFGTGSNEIIELAMRTFVSTDEHVMSPAPSFSVYGIIAQAMRASCKWIPTKEDFSYDFEKLAEEIDDKTRIIFLANPNNPTGLHFTDEELVNFMEKVPADCIVVMDEAYYEYVDANDYPDTIKMLDKYPNMMVMRTFSKAYGLAALRVGFAVGHPDAIDMLNRVRQPFNTNMGGQIAAEAALDDSDFLRRVIHENRQGKAYIYRELERLGIEYVPTQANFMLVKVGDGEKVFNELLKEGVIVRYLGPGLGEYIRVSIGTADENGTFIEKLEKILKR
ncbi:histidinol-phosphate transaminase [Limisalsivibrio acetivorans]|uniref:histidinol-phosphate transaminase n=1 Tax=Limisalsivibrio acetivorans TaxID=1304888 RepID=UPI0003B52297|nr:histidinol-phosphate transaminase [Limisalsivibrio acetivorans]